MPRFIERIPHPDADRVIPTALGDIKVVAHAVETEVADAIHWLERNGFVRVQEVAHDEAPVEEAPTEEAPTEEAPAEEAPAEDAPASVQEKA